MHMKYAVMIPLISMLLYCASTRKHLWISQKASRESFERKVNH